MRTDFTSKTCPKCKRHLPAKDFGLRKNTPDAHAWACRECTRAANKTYQLKNPRPAKPKSPEQSLRWYAHKYGITPDELIALREAHAGRCGLCGKKKPLHIDHDHATGRVRGLLCIGCNTWLGWVGLRRLESSRLRPI